MRQFNGGGSLSRGDDEFLTARELADWLRVKLPTIRAWTRKGLPCLRAGKLCRYEKAAVREWLEARAARGKASSEAGRDETLAALGAGK